MANDIITIEDSGAVVGYDHSRDDPQLGMSRDEFRRSLIDYYERCTGGKLAQLQERAKAEFPEPEPPRRFGRGKGPLAFIYRDLDTKAHDAWSARRAAHDRDRKRAAGTLKTLYTDKKRPDGLWVQLPRWRESVLAERRVMEAMATRWNGPLRQTLNDLDAGHSLYTPRRIEYNLSHPQAVLPPVQPIRPRPMHSQRSQA